MKDEIIIGNGNYKLDKTIGSGTFGKVKAGIHAVTLEKVAVKVLEKSKISQLEDIERVKREIKFLKKLNHPNVIKLLEIVEDKTSIYLVMEYAGGGELFNHIVKKKRLNEYEASFFFYQIIEGLDSIHKSEIVHRDLKPENLLFNEQKQLKIIDFGLSNSYIEGGNLLVTPCGSPCYAAPEMVLGHKYSGVRVDTWSVGIILFAMTAGYLPFEDQNNEKLFRKIVKCKLEYPSYVTQNSIDMISLILDTNPDTRITIKEIKNHPFYLQGKNFYLKHMRGRYSEMYSSFKNSFIDSLGDPMVNKSYYFTIRKQCEYLVKKFVMEKMVKDYKYKPEEVQLDISLNKHNNLTSTFHLLVNKYLNDNYLLEVLFEKEERKMNLEIEAQSLSRKISQKFSEIKLAMSKTNSEEKLINGGNTNWRQQISGPSNLVKSISKEIKDSAPSMYAAYQNINSSSKRGTTEKDPANIANEKESDRQRNSSIRQETLSSVLNTTNSNANNANITAKAFNAEMKIRNAYQPINTDPDQYIPKSTSVVKDSHPTKPKNSNNDLVGSIISSYGGKSGSKNEKEIRIKEKPNHVSGHKSNQINLIKTRISDSPAVEPIVIPTTTNKNGGKFDYLLNNIGASKPLENRSVPKTKESNISNSKTLPMETIDSNLDSSRKVSFKDKETKDHGKSQKQSLDKKASINEEKRKNPNDLKFTENYIIDKIQKKHIGSYSNREPGVKLSNKLNLGNIGNTKITKNNSIKGTDNAELNKTGKSHQSGKSVSIDRVKEKKPKYISTMTYNNQLYNYKNFSTVSAESSGISFYKAPSKEMMNKAVKIREGNNSQNKNIKADLPSNAESHISNSQKRTIDVSASKPSAYKNTKELETLRQSYESKNKLNTQLTKADSSSNKDKVVIISPRSINKTQVSNFNNAPVNKYNLNSSDNMTIEHGSTPHNLLKMNLNKQASKLKKATSIGSPVIKPNQINPNIKQNLNLEKIKEEVLAAKERIKTISVVENYSTSNNIAKDKNSVDKKYLHTDSHVNTQYNTNSNNTNSLSVGKNLVSNKYQGQSNIISNKNNINNLRFSHFNKSSITQVKKTSSKGAAKETSDSLNKYSKELLSQFSVNTTTNKNKYILNYTNRDQHASNNSKYNYCLTENDDINKNKYNSIESDRGENYKVSMKTQNRFSPKIEELHMSKNKVKISLNHNAQQKGKMNLSIQELEAKIANVKSRKNN